MTMDKSPKIEKAEQLLKKLVGEMYALPLSVESLIFIDPQGANQEIEASRKREREWISKNMGHKQSEDIHKLTYEDLLSLTTIIPEAKETSQRSIIEHYLHLYLLNNGPWKLFIMDCITDIRDEKIRIQNEQKP